MWDSARFFALFSNVFAEFFPNLHELLRILCTLPIKSAVYERLFDMRRNIVQQIGLGHWTASAKTSDQKSGLHLMNIHYSIATNDTFARKHLRCLLLAFILDHKATVSDEVDRDVMY